MFYITSISHFCESNAIDDAKRNEGLVTPEDVQRFDDISYGDDECAFFLRQMQKS